MNSYWSYSVENLQNLEPINEDQEDDFEEEKVISKAEKRFDELSKFFNVLEGDHEDLVLVSLTSQQNRNVIDLKFEYETLRKLLLERAHLKIQHFYQDSLTHVKEIFEECKKILRDQESNIENFKIGYLKNFKPHNTYFDEFASLGATLKMHTTHWIQTKQMILTNRWYFYELNRYLEEYLRNLHIFLNLCLQINRSIKSLIDNGIYVLCRVSEDAWLDTSLDDYGQDFFSTFDHLNGVQRHLSELIKSISGKYARSSDIDFSHWTLDRLFEKLATEDGQWLAQSVLKEFGKKLFAKDMGSEKAGNKKVLPEIVGTGTQESAGEQEGPSIDDLLNFGQSYLSIPAMQQPMIKIPPPPPQKKPLVSHTVGPVSTGLAMQEKSQNDTSDYYSSSASSSKTLTEVDKPQVVSQNGPELKKAMHPSVLSKKLKKQLQNFYSNFLEHRYTTFNLLLEEGAKHKSLHPAAAGGVPEPQERPVTVMTTAKKSVKWLDDTLKQNKKQMWKKYIEVLWASFLDEWARGMFDGRSNVQMMKLVDYGSAKKVAIMVLDTLLMVQLPKELSPCDLLVHQFRRSVCLILLDSDFQHALWQCDNPKLSKRPATQEATGQAPLASTFDRLQKLASAVEDPSKTAAVNRIVLYHLMSQMVTGLTGYDLTQGYAHVQAYVRQIDDEGGGRTVEVIFGLLQKWLRSKLAFTTKDALEEVFPPKKYWRSPSSVSGDQANDAYYLESVESCILDPVLKAARLLPNQDRAALLVLSLDEVMRAWLQWIKQSDIRFSRTGAAQLRHDFETIRNYVQSYDGLSPTEKDSISNVPILGQAFVIADILEGKSTGPAATYTKRQRWRNFKVEPKIIEDEKEDPESAKSKEKSEVILKPDLQLWTKHRSKAMVPNCFCFS